MNQELKNMFGDLVGKRLEKDGRDLSTALMSLLHKRLSNIETPDGKIRLIFGESLNQELDFLSGSPGHRTIEIDMYKRSSELKSGAIDPALDRTSIFLGIDSIGNGVTFGGVRLLPFGAEQEARRDALRLSEAMTHKLAMINEPFGGSKLVVLASESGKDESLLNRIGEFTEALNGMFITAIDFGFEPQDAITISEKTRFILGFDGPGSVGASGITTAIGAFIGMSTILEEAFGTPQIKGRSFAIQGAGSVGRKLAELLIDAGADVFISDIDESRLKPFTAIGRASIVDPQDILFMDVDVLCPSGPACIINPATIPRLKSRVIAGVANCVLEDESRDDMLLKEKGILLAPDFVLNAGGVIQGIEEYKGRGLKDAVGRLPIIPKNLRDVFKQARQDKTGTAVAAKKVLRERSKLYVSQLF